MPQKQEVNQSKSLPEIDAIQKEISELARKVDALRNSKDYRGAYEVREQEIHARERLIGMQMKHNEHEKAAEGYAHLAQMCIDRAREVANRIYVDGEATPTGQEAVLGIYEDSADYTRRAAQEYKNAMKFEKAANGVLGFKKGAHMDNYSFASAKETYENLIESYKNIGWDDMTKNRLTEKLEAVTKELKDTEDLISMGQLVKLGERLKTKNES